jgi:phospholipase C
LTYDENDGFFDHVVPPTPPMSNAQGISTVGTVNEIFDGTESPNVPAYTETGYIPGPYGLGVRVPMIAISPWSKGGYVNSQVFDHTSLIRFLEQRFGHHDPSLVESNITEWRRTVTGDLTSCFNFAKPNAVVVPKLPTTSAYAPPTAAEIAAGTRFPDYVPVPPTSSTIARQEPGIRPARALPYRPLVQGTALSAAHTFTLNFGNCGAAGIAYHVRQSGVGAPGPWTFTIAPDHKADHVWNLGATGASSAYDLSVYGPNGWYRLYKGSVEANAANLSVETDETMYDDALRLTIHNRGAGDLKVSIHDEYTGEALSEMLRVGCSITKQFELAASHNWYDLIVRVDGDPFEQRLAGHLENGRDSFTDPAMGNPGS